jgi:hypothetical protein
MKLYKLPTAPAGERWHSAKTGLKDFEELELPKDGRAGMAAFLNGNEREVGNPALVAGTLAVATSEVERFAHDALELAELKAVAAARQTTMPQQSQLTADAIVEFILGDATVAQTETIFAAIGTRFKEQARGS